MAAACQRRLKNHERGAASLHRGMLGCLWLGLGALCQLGAAQSAFTYLPMRVRLQRSAARQASKKANCCKNGQIIKNMDPVTAMRNTEKRCPQADARGFAVVDEADTQQTLNLDDIIVEVSSAKMSPMQAISLLLTDDEVDSDELKLKKLRKVLGESLEWSGYDSVAPAADQMFNWNGLDPQQEPPRGIRSAKKFPIFFTAFAAMRAYCTENADFFDVRQTGGILEGLTRLARKMWAADDRVTGAMSMILNKELLNGDASDPGLSNADIIGTLGLRRPFQAMAYAALDLPADDMKHVDAVASIAWALALANIQQASLQIKVAKGVIAHIDKVQPPDIGKLFVAMHEEEWFKDAGLASMLAAKAEEAQELQDGA
ncbi:unnamed protein product [Effrenium voratum]|uniref:Uncharacterized protein n=1 Tax=Effrenium voratum TaxID=2562239 RepID=A0AA36IGX0_9DINO|nr:unnamed protein product [Effrenium voratum]CAJ1386513.1 unnamed protein product [Effrenium voratum]CAJ1422057.1 unnamed protein product [Effrenium voratum]